MNEGQSKKDEVEAKPITVIINQLHKSLQEVEQKTLISTPLHNRMRGSIKQLKYYLFTLSLYGAIQ